MTGQAPSMSTCGKCGAAMDPSRAMYDKSGNLLCPACSAHDQIAEGDARAISSTVGSAIGILVGGVLSMTCFNPVFLISIITVVSAIGWLAMIARNPAHRAKMGGRFIPALIAVCIGLVLGALPLLFVALGITAAALGG